MSSRPGGQPLLYMDVDGVLNCFGDLGASLVSFEAEFVALDRYVIHIPEGTADRLARLEEWFDCVWATTWQHHAFAELGPALGLRREWPVLEFPHDGLERDHKLPAIVQDARLRPAAWIDDELTQDAKDWARERERHGIDTFLVPTQPNVGLTEQDTQALVNWGQFMAAKELQT